MAHGRALGSDLLCPLNAEMKDHLPFKYISEDEARLARGNGKADEKIACITHAHDFQTSKGA